MNKTTQKQILLDYLKTYGHIDQVTAFYEIGTTRLAARISDLRRDGHHIVTMKKKGILKRTGHPFVAADYYYQDND